MSRGFGYNGPQAITVADVWAYLALTEEDNVAERLKFLRIIQGMDRAFLAHSAKLQAAST